MERGVVVWFFLNMFSFTTVYADNQVDALIALKNSLHDPAHVFDSWVGTNHCTWFHITCDAYGNVKRIDLGNSQLSGTLVPQLGDLTMLKQLVMYENKISGHIPKELGKLSNLEILDLHSNLLTGTIPPELGNLNPNNLKHLLLDSNNLCGIIPVHALTRINPYGGVIDLTNNPRLCTHYTNPQCSNKNCH